MPKVALAADEGVPLDRAYAIESGAKRFDAENPGWLPKTHFLQSMRHERLAGLGLDFDEANHVLTLFRGPRQIARGALKTKPGLYAKVVSAGEVEPGNKIEPQISQVPPHPVLLPRGEGTPELPAARFLGSSLPLGERDRVRRDFESRLRLSRSY